MAAKNSNVQFKYSVELWQKFDFEFDADRNLTMTKLKCKDRQEIWWETAQKRVIRIQMYSHTTTHD